MANPNALNTLDKGDGESIAWMVVEVLSSGSDTASAIVGVLRFAREVYGFEEEDGTGVVPNPLFLANGHGGPSPKTRQYLTNRKLKSLGGGAVGLTGALASGVTLVDVGGLALHGNAVGTTTGHLIVIKAVGGRFKRSQTITRWVDAMIAAKSAKLAVRGSSLAAAAIPVPALGIGVNIGTTLARLGIKLTLGKLVARTAMEVHWRAYQELVLGRAFGGVPRGAAGPASAMFYEIFTKRGFTRVFGKYDIERLIREPGGWIALNDKLMLM